jgi:hypothetical protein
MMTRSGSKTCVALALALGAAACGGGDHKAGPDAASPGSDGSAPIDAAAPGPAVLAVERVFTPTSRSYFLSVLPDVPTGTIDRSHALELVSADVEFYGGKIFIRDRVANTMTRYIVTADGALQADGDPLSFASYALADARFSDAFIAADTAFLLDSTGWRLIPWNPTTMKLAGEPIDISAMKKGALPGAISVAVQAGGRFIAAVSWAQTDSSMPLVTYGGSGVIVYDPAANPVLQLVEQAKVGGGFRVTAADDGDAYLTGVVGGDMHLFGTVFDGAPAPTSGIVRLPAGATAFDLDSVVDVEAITRTKGVGAVHRLSETAVLAQILDPAFTALPAKASDFVALKHFFYVLIDPETQTVTRVPEIDEGGLANAGNHTVDGKLYIQQANAAGTGSVVYSVAGTTIGQAFTVPAGDLWFMARIR